MHLAFVFVLLLPVFGDDIYKEGYLLDTPYCKIPDIKPFSDEIKNISQQHPYINCTSLELLTSVDKTDRFAVLNIAENLISSYAGEDLNLTCCYSKVSRSGSVDLPDVGIQLSQCTTFEGSVKFGEKPLLVRCTKITDGSLVYENVHSPVVVTESVEEKLKSEKLKKKASVLFVVVDSVSRLNLVRTMKNTRDFLLNNDFIEMKGYNKIDDNTFPNFIALLTGLTRKQAYSTCKPFTVGGLDKNNCPMIWYDYSDLGYVTAYAEDDTTISTYNYQMKGFLNPPTDYYFKPYMEAAETLKIIEVARAPYCTGPETSGERILNLAKDFAVTFKNHSSFGIFWMNTFSHNHINFPYTMDGKVEQYFKDLKSEGVLDESIVVFLADHGMRFGEVLLTTTGWFEERLPLNLISIPKWFRQQFPKEYANLKDNAVHKLTNTFDLYMTLQHILSLSGAEREIVPSKACPKCQSLFQPIPVNRTCEDASIPPEWCTCMGKVRAINVEDQLAKNATLVTLTKIKTILDANAPSMCAEYRVNYISYARISENVDYTNYRYFYVIFETEPKAQFIVTLRFNGTITSTDDVLYIKRYDSFYTTGKCVAGDVQKYCNCIS